MTPADREKTLEAARAFVGDHPELDLDPVLALLDFAAAETAWADRAEKAGSEPRIIEIAREHADKMDAWPKKKIADLPPEPLSNVP